MSLLHAAFLYAIALHARTIINALECYTCTNATFIGACGKVIQCPDGSVCHKEYETLHGIRHFTLGCKPDSMCPATTSVPMVGRATYSRSADTCSECCSDSLCNRQLCQHGYPHCADNTDVNCDLMGTMTPICTDTRHIINVCKRYCGLCSLVDGAWSQWGSWTGCDVTCENGTRSRSRKCDHPTPAYGGYDCVGESSDSETCVVDTTCPVDEGWAPWSSWGVCSTTCDIGLKKRHRSCANPDPSFYGKLCRGDSHEEHLCYPGACADGSWSQWEHWSTCSLTCGGGLTSRARLCDNPAPSLTGTNCVGDSKETAICNSEPCHHTVAFRAHDVANYTHQWTTNEHIVFTTVGLNEGGGYSSNSGVFTTPRKGIYLFTVQLCTTPEHFFVAFIMTSRVTGGSVSNKDKDYYMCVSGSAIMSLQTGEQVWVQVKYGSPGQSLIQTTTHLNIFSGTLIGN